MTKSNKKFFISTAIDYPSAPAHLGHCLEKVQADVIARYKRAQGFDVHFSVGTDEHGLKIQRCAEKAGKTPQEFVDETSKYFKDAWTVLNISNDDFIRTTDKRHEKVVQALLKKINDTGDIYKGKYKGLYCVDCETYYLPKDLKGGKCPTHNKIAEAIEEETYFFRTSKYQKKLIKHIQENKNFIIPDTKKNEILNRLKEPLQDLSITRQTTNWGIPFLLDNKLSLFVWVEALMNYLTTIDYPNAKFGEYWPADVHVIGKDIVWHHSVIFGSLLLSLGLPLPKTIFVHGFITADGQKMSKSLGNIVDPIELVGKYGTDPVRYFLLREISPVEDGDFTIAKFEERYNADLANGLGNLLARVLTVAEKASAKRKVQSAKPQRKIQNLINKIQQKYKIALDNFKFNEALASIWQLISFCDECIEKEKPWEETEKKLTVISDLLAVLSEIANLLEPFLPDTAQRIKDQLKAGKKGKSLFPRL